MSEVVKLRSVDPEQTDPTVVERLEEVLEQAKQGKVSSVAIAIVLRDGSTGSGWSKLPSLASMLGSIEFMKAKMLIENIKS